MSKVIETIINLINDWINIFKQLLKPNKKTPTINVTITINGGENNKVSVYHKN